MWPTKEGYNFISVNFGGYQLCKTLDEAKTVASSMKPDAGTVYTNGFFSERLQQHVGKGQWFPLKEEEPDEIPLPRYLTDPGYILIPDTSRHDG
jgi:hypothetical protein